jgi:uncharacterized protein (TIGR03437 family)
MRAILTWTLLLAGAGFPAAAGNQVLLRYLQAADGAPEALAADQSGHLFIVAGTNGDATRVIKLDLDGARLASLDIGLAQLSYGPTAITDAQGNLIIGGQNTSGQGVILKFGPQLDAAPVFSQSLPATVAALAADASGNIYVTGYTTSASFPLTPGAYQTKPPGKPSFGNGSATYAFLTEISPAGQILYSTYFGDDATICGVGSSCIGAMGITTAAAIAVSASGRVVIAGSTGAVNLPTTPGALSGTCDCSYLNRAGFVAEFQPGAAQQLQWSTFLNTTSTPESGVAVNALAFDAAGNVIAGGNATTGLPTTAGTIQPTVISVPGTADSGGFVLKLNATGTAVVWGTYFGGSPFAYVRSLRVDPQGRVVFTGVTVDPSQAALSGNPWFRPSYVARVSSDGATLVDFFKGPNGLVGLDLAITSNSGFAAVGPSGALWIETANSGPSLLAITNSSNGQSVTAVVPFELLTLYGIGLGPQTPLNGQIQDGAFTNALGGDQVLFDSAAAPLLYAGSGQINAVVPGLYGASTRISIATAAGTVVGPTLAVPSQTLPAVFQDNTTGLAAALNQDGSVNSFSNPAKAGSIVTVFVNGAGSVGYAAGTIVPPVIYNSTYPVWAGGQLSYEVLFAGDAPGLVAGVMQVNFRLPASVPALTAPYNTLAFSLMVGGVASAPSAIAVAP